MHYTTLYLLKSSVYFHRCKFFWIVNISFSKNFPNLEICEQYFIQSLRMCMSAWTPVMDKMLVCKPIQYLQTICSSCAKKDIIWHGQPFYNIEHLLLAVQVPAPDHLCYLGVRSYNYRLKYLNTYRTLMIQQIRL